MTNRNQAHVEVPSTGEVVTLMVARSALGEMGTLRKAVHAATCMGHAEQRSTALGELVSLCLAS